MPLFAKPKAISSGTYSENKAGREHHPCKAIRGHAVQEVRPDRSGRVAITLKRHFLVVTHARQQTFPDGCTIPARFFKSFPTSIGKGAYPLGNQDPILPIDLLAFFATLQVNPQVGQLNWRETTRSRQSTTLPENIVLV
jgi:hypothetical protein